MDAGSGTDEGDATGSHHFERRSRGHLVLGVVEWRYEDGTPHRDEERSCVVCHRTAGDALPSGDQAPDPCLGMLDGVEWACCGHGYTDHAYVVFDNGDRLYEGDALEHFASRSDVAHLDTVRGLLHAAGEAADKDHEPPPMMGRQERVDLLFERFTDRARRIVVLARQEARRRGHDEVTVEDVWDACYLEGEGVAARVLTGLGYEYDPGDPDDPVKILGHIEYAPATKKVWEWALSEALKLGHNYIGTEHILLGLLRTGTVGGRFDVAPNAIRGAVHGALRAQPTATPPAPERQHRVTLTPLGEGRWRAALEIGGETVVAAEGDNQLDATATALDDLGRRVAAGETFETPDGKTIGAFRTAEPVPS